MVEKRKGMSLDSEEPAHKRPSLPALLHHASSSLTRMFESPSEMHFHFTHTDGSSRKEDESGAHHSYFQHLKECQLGWKARKVQEYKQSRLGGGEWEWAEIRVTHDVHSSRDYVKLEPASVAMLENYMRKDCVEFVKHILTDPELKSPALAATLQDLTSNLPGGPIFHHDCTFAIIKAMYEKLQLGASLNDELLRVAISLIAQLLHEHSTPHSSPHSTKQHWDLELTPENMEHLTGLCSLLTGIGPQDATKCNDDVDLYSRALRFVMMVEGARGAARLTAAENEKHWENVTGTIRFAFGAAKAIVSNTPVGALVPPVLLDSTEEWVLKRSHGVEKPNQKAVVESAIDRFVTRTCAKAMEGVGLFDVHEDVEKYEVVGSPSDSKAEKSRKLRKQTGKKFVEFVEIIRKLV